MLFCTNLLSLRGEWRKKITIRDYLTYRKLEKEFNPEDSVWNAGYNDPEQYMESIREGKRNALKRVAKKSLINLATLASLVGCGLYLNNSEEEYNRIIDEAARSADLNSDGELSGTKEMAEFYSNLPGLINFARW